MIDAVLVLITVITTSIKKLGKIALSLGIVNDAAQKWLAIFLIFLTGYIFERLQLPNRYEIKT